MSNIFFLMGFWSKITKIQISYSTALTGSFAWVKPETSYVVRK